MLRAIFLAWIRFLKLMLYVAFNARPYGGIEGYVTWLER